MAAAAGPHDPAAPDVPGQPVVAVDVSGLPAAADGDLLCGLGAIAALARLRLAARRTGHRVRLRGASPELRALVESAGLGGEFEWEAEEREEVRGVEE